jgi:three-Cys-motif partner protein
MIPPNYQDREQAFIKHTLLRAYLERLFMIIGQQETRICYVDCFAGPWQEGSVDLKDTSISISLEIMQKCYESLRERTKNINFRALFIEKEKGPFSKLSTYLKNNHYPDVETKALNGDFYSLRSEIITWCENDFAFFFIDPTGWKKILDLPTLLPLIKRPRSEYLITFMFDFLQRAQPQKIHKTEMVKIFGEYPDIAGMSLSEKENYFLKLYQKNIKAKQISLGKKIYSAFVRVLYPCKDRTFYNLVYFTTHPYGVIVFMEESEKIDLIQRRARAYAKQESRIKRTRQQELFPSQVNLNNEPNIDLSIVKDYWMKKLSKEPKQIGIKDIAEMLEDTGWFIGDFQSALLELLKDKKVENLDAKGMRRKHAIHFKDSNGNGEYIRIKEL